MDAIVATFNRVRPLLEQYQRTNNHTNYRDDPRQVHQLDSMLFDSEILSMLGSQVKRAFSMFPSSSWDHWKHEVTAGLRATVFFGSASQTYGQMMHGMAYARYSPAQRLAYSVSSVFLPYLWAYWWKRVRERPKWATAVDNLVTLGSALNLLLFLVYGRYPNLARRVTGMRTVYVTRRVPHNVVFDFMNRQLVWQSFTEFLLFFLPLVNVDKLKRFFVNRLMVPDHATPEDHCAICKESPIRLPHVTTCGHVFCYWCISCKLAEGDEYLCPRCASPLGPGEKLAHAHM